MTDAKKTDKTTGIDWLKESYSTGTPVQDCRRDAPSSQYFAITCEWAVDTYLKSNPPRWTPIEETGEWDGDQRVYVTRLYPNGKNHAMTGDWKLTTARGIDRVEAQIFVYPIDTPPPFYPEDYEVKP